MIKTKFDFGSSWQKVDFHLHTRVDDEFDYSDDDYQYTNNYVNALIKAKIRLGIITNHNKFNLREFQNLKKSRRKYWFTI